METANLETGNYYLTTVSYTSRPPVSRPLGVGKNPTEIVVLPLGTPPPEWYIRRLANDRSIVTIEGITAVVDHGDGALRLIHRLPPFQWRVLRGAPCPPPIGEDSFVIMHINGQEGWFIPSTEDDQEIEVPVVIGDNASTIHIVSSRQGFTS